MRPERHFALKGTFPIETIVKKTAKIPKIPKKFAKLFFEKKNWKKIKKYIFPQNGLKMASKWPQNRINMGSKMAFSLFLRYFEWGQFQFWPIVTFFDFDFFNFFTGKGGGSLTRRGGGPLRVGEGGPLRVGEGGLLRVGEGGPPRKT